MSHTYRFLCLVFTAFIPFSLLEAKPSGTVKLRLLANELPDGLEKVTIQANKKKSEPMDLPINQLSEPISVSGRLVTLEPAGGGAPLCDVTLPEDGRSFSLLLVVEEPAGYAPFVIRTDDRAFKSGDVFFINHTSKAIVLRLGGTDLVVEPGQTSISRPTKPENNSYQIVISERGEDGDKIISSTRWPVQEGLRSYVFITENANGKTTYRAVDEYVESK